MMEVTIEGLNLKIPNLVRRGSCERCGSIAIMKRLSDGRIVPLKDQRGNDTMLCLQCYEKDAIKKYKAAVKAASEIKEEE